MGPVGKFRLWRAAFHFLPAGIMDARGRSRLGSALESRAGRFRLVDADHCRHLDVEVRRPVVLANPSCRSGVFSPLVHIIFQ